MIAILRREFIALLRTRRAIALQLALALACGLLVLLRWPTGGALDRDRFRAVEVLRAFGYGLLAAVLMIVPAFPATALVREKVQGTLALLLDSPLRPWAIYLGKLLAVLGFAAVLLAMTLPAAAACYALGGLPERHGILRLYAVLALAVLQTATLGLLVSSTAWTLEGALRTTYALVLGGSVAVLLPHALWQGTAGPLAEAAAWLRNLSPIPAVMDVLGQGSAATLGLASTGDPVTRYTLLALASSLVFAVMTVARLSHNILERARPAGVMTEDRSRGGQAVRRLVFLVDPQRRSRPLGRWLNPVMVKEFRTRALGRSHWALRLLALTAVASLALSTLAATGALGWGADTIAAGLVLLQAALLVLFGPSLAGGLVSAEREAGTWDLLRMTPLSAGAVLRGKLASAVWPLLLLLGATLPGYIVMMTIEPGQAYRVARVLACLALTGVFAVLVSACASTLFRSTAAALAVSYAVLLAVCVGTLLVWLGRGAPFGHATVQAALRINPVAAALQASGLPGFAGYDLVPATWWIAGGACALLLALLGLRTWQLGRPE